MKRSFDDMMESFTKINLTGKKVRTKEKKEWTKELKDPFKLGRDVRGKDSYTRDEVIEIINKRENILNDMFKIFVQREFKQSERPTWVK